MLRCQQGCNKNVGSFVERLCAAFGFVVGSSCWPTVKDRCRGFAKGFCCILDFACVLHAFGMIIKRVRRANYPGCFKQRRADGQRGDWTDVGRQSVCL
jgi:hypothetical protein